MNAFCAFINFLSARPAHFFLLAGTVFGLYFVIVTPPFQMPDEYAHFERIYALSEGKIIAKSPPADGHIDYVGVGVMPYRHESGGGGEYNPDSFLRLYNLTSHLPYQPQNKIDFKTIISGFDIPLEPARQSFRTHNAAVYSPVAYLPQVVVTFILKSFSLSPQYLFYAARLINLLVWLGLGFCAISLLPFGGWVLAFVALSPMAVYEGAAISADGLTMGLCWVFTALVMRHIKTREAKIPTCLFIILPLVLAIIALCKFFYFFIFLLLILLRPKGTGNKIRYILLGLLCAVVPFAASTLWAYQVKDLYTFMPEAAGGRQIEFIINQPLGYAKIFIGSLLHESRIWARHFAGVLGWLDAPLPFAVAAFYLLVLALSPFMTMAKSVQKQIGFVWADRLCMAGVFLLELFIIMTSLYIANSAYASPIFGGMQGRYLLPVAPVLLLSFSGLTGNGETISKRLLGVLAPSVILVLVYSAVMLWSRYYLQVL